MIYQNVLQSIREGRKLLAILLDPDKMDTEMIKDMIPKINESRVDFIFVGGSTVAEHATQDLVIELRKNTSLPIILFPGHYNQITPQADAILFLSLISGRNPEYLINQQVKAVPLLQKTELEVIPTGYILIDGGTNSSVLKVSKTTPIPQNNIELAVSTAIAGMYKGKQLIYLEAGSGAKKEVSPKLISEVKKNINIPLIVGGGIKSKEQLNNAYNSGADLVVIGTAFENKLDL